MRQSKTSNVCLAPLSVIQDFKDPPNFNENSDNFDSDATLRLSGGHQAKEGQFPQFASIRIRRKNIESICGGVLVSNRHILTAGHCLRDFEGVSQEQLIVEVAFGIHSPQNWHQKGVEPLQVKRLCRSKKFKQFEKGMMIHDIGVLRLEIQLQFSDYLQPACEPSKFITENDQCFAIGTGKISENNKADVLHYLPVRFVRCRAYKKKDKSRICFKSNGASGDTCAGDSGAPIVCPLTDQSTGKVSWELFGLTSYGQDVCEEGKSNPSINFDVKRQLKSVRSLIKECD